MATQNKALNDAKKATRVEAKFEKLAALNAARRQKELDDEAFRLMSTEEKKEFTRNKKIMVKALNLEKKLTKALDQTHALDQTNSSIQNAIKVSGVLEEEKEEDFDKACYMCDRKFKSYEEIHQTMWLTCEECRDQWCCNLCLPLNFNRNTEYLCNNCK